MARGFVVGNVVNAANGRPLEGAQVGLNHVWGADVNGPLVAYTVPIVEIAPNYPTDRRLTDRNGVFKIPFSWDAADPNNLARAIGVTLLGIKVIVFPPQGDYKTFEGGAMLALDVPQLVEEFKNGRLLLYGTGQNILDRLTETLKGALSGQDMGPVPFTALSIEQIAIIGILPNLLF